MGRKLTTNEFIEKAIRVHGDKFLYDQTEYINRRTKVLITCKKHGVFPQNPDDHLGGHGCPGCKADKTKLLHQTNKGLFGRLEVHRMTTGEFIERAKTIHGDTYDYSQVEYQTIGERVTIICRIHGPFLQIAGEHINSGSGCRKCAAKERGRITTLRAKNAFLEKAKTIHGDKYDYSQTDYQKALEKVTIICKVHGPFLQKPANHLTGYGCNRCAKERSSKANTKTTAYFIECAQKVHGDTYDYSQAEYIGKRKPVTIICKKHGPFKLRPDSHIVQGTPCPHCVRESNSTKGEDAVARVLDSLGYSYFREFVFEECRNEQPLSFDFCVHSGPVIALIEYDGGQHFFPVKAWGGERIFKRIQLNDSIKNNFAQARSIPLLRIPYTQFKQIEPILTGWLPSVLPR